MTIDVEHYLGAVTRSVEMLEREGKPAHMVRLTRIYDTSVEDLWDAVTNAERIPRWFLPVSGDLRVGGRFQLKGNAGGEILVCDEPRHLAVTWEMGGDVSWVDVHVAPAEKGSARLTLEHVAHESEFWGKFGPGAVGVGWDLALLGLGLYLQGGEVQIDEATWSASEEGKRYIRGSSEDWGRASIAAGTQKAAATAAARNTTAFYTGESPAGG